MTLFEIIGLSAVFGAIGAGIVLVFDYARRPPRPQRPFRTIWVVGIVLTRRTADGSELTQTISWRSDVSEDAARGAAVAYAQKTKPGYSIELIVTAQIELPAQPCPPAP